MGRDHRDLWSYMIHYHRLGLTPIPLKERSKAPAIPDWPRLLRHRPSIQQYRCMYDDGLFGNIGIGLTKVKTRDVSGFLSVIDLDNDATVNAFFSDLLDLAKKTIVVRTGKGYHVYVVAPNPLDKVWSHHDKYAFDVKGYGSYVVAPPSIHPESGTTYHFLGTRTVINFDDKWQKYIDTKIKTLNALVDEQLHLSFVLSGKYVPSEKRRRAAELLLNYLEQKYEEAMSIIKNFERWNASLYKPFSTSQANVIYNRHVSRLIAFSNSLTVVTVKKYPLSILSQEKVAFTRFGLNRFRTVFLNDLEKLFGYILIKPRFRVYRTVLGTLAYNNKKNAFVIINLRGNYKSSLADLVLRYSDLIYENKEDLLEAYRQIFPDSRLGRDDIAWHKLEFIFISKRFSSKQRLVIMLHDLHVRLYELRTRHGCLELVRIKA